MSRSVTHGTLLGCIALQVVFAVVVPIVTSAQLSSGGSCYLNQSGNVCSFAYVTSGFSLFFSILLALGTASTLRAVRKAPTTSFLPGEAGSVAAFAAFWWMAAAIAFTKRGAQATDAGLPATSARNAVIALSWLEFAAFVVAAVAVALDRMRHAKHAAYLAAAAERLIDKKREADREAERERYRAASQASSQFKTATFELSPSASKSLSVTTTPMPSAAALQAPQLATAV